MADAPVATQNAPVRVHAAVLRSPRHVPQARKVHRVRIHALGARAQPLHLDAGEQAAADVAPVVLPVGLSVHFGRHRGRDARQRVDLGNLSQLVGGRLLLGGDDARLADVVGPEPDVRAGAVGWGLDHGRSRVAVGGDPVVLDVGQRDVVVDHHVGVAAEDLVLLRYRFVADGTHLAKKKIHELRDTKVLII